MGKAQTVMTIRWNKMIALRTGRPNRFQRESGCWICDMITNENNYPASGSSFQLLAVSDQQTVFSLLSARSENLIARFGRVQQRNSCQLSAISFYEDEGFPGIKGMAKGPPINPGCISNHGGLSAPRAIWPYVTTPPIVRIHSGKFSRRMRAKWKCRARSFLRDQYGFSERIRPPSAAGQGCEPDTGEAISGFGAANERSETHAHRPLPKTES